MASPLETPREIGQAAFAAVSAAFESLGRACMALDGQFRVRHVSPSLDALLGPGAADRVRGQPIESLVDREVFGPGGPLREGLVAGERLEGWRALLRTGEGSSRLFAVSAASLAHRDGAMGDPDALYLVVLRPAEDDGDEHLAPPDALANERALLKRALDAHRWNRVETASALGMSRSTLWRRMRAVGLE